jgi:predicted TIM-barrel fold metal-dependent hydrolase
MTRKIIDFDYGLTISEPHLIKPDLIYQKRYGIQVKRMTLEETIAQLKEAGIDHAVIAASDVETTHGRKVPNERIAELCKKHSDIFVFGFAGSDPHKGMAAVRELEHAIKDLGLKGCYVNPWYHQIKANDRRYYLLYEKCAELNIPVSLHTASSLDYTISMDYGNPAHIDDVAVDIPELKIIMRHPCWPWVSQGIAVAYRHPNVYIDISAMHPMMIPEIVQASRTILKEKLLFGSAHPLMEPKKAVKWWESLNLEEDVKDHLFYKNAARLIGLHENL